MRPSDYKLLMDLCEKPGSFIQLVEDLADNKFDETLSPKLIRAYFKEHMLSSRIEDFKIESQVPVIILFKLFGDPTVYFLQGCLDEEDRIHVSLGRKTQVLTN